MLLFGPIGSARDGKRRRGEVEDSEEERRFRRRVKRMARTVRQTTATPPTTTPPAMDPECVDVVPPVTGGDGGDGDVERGVEMGMLVWF